MNERERWDRRYAAAERLHRPVASSFLSANLPRLPRGDALDLAMGEGRNAVLLADSGWRVVGVDLSLVAVFRARALARERAVALKAVVADLGSFELGVGRWDLITDIRFLDRSLFPRIVRALRPGGVLLLEHFTTAHLDIARQTGRGPKDPAHLLALGEAAELVAPLRVLYHEEGMWDEGRGTAALVRLLAQRI